MEEPSAEPGRELTPEQLAERLRKLEEESALLRAALESAPLAEDEPDAVPEVPVPVEDVNAAEQALSRWRLESSRGNKEIAANFLKEAVAAAPNHLAVLEAQGDDALARRQNKQALEFYRLAKEAAPGNLGLEKKHADLAFSVLANAASMDMQIGEFESVASAKSATMLSVFFPGVGHMVLGQWVKGIACLVLFAACFVWILMVAPTMGDARGSNFNPVALAPFIGAVMIWIAAIADLQSQAKVLDKRRQMAQKLRVPPPENLPYE